MMIFSAIKPRQKHSGRLTSIQSRAWSIGRRACPTAKLGISEHSERITSVILVGAVTAHASLQMRGSSPWAIRDGTFSSPALFKQKNAN